MFTSSASAITSAVIASTTTTARGTITGSCLPPAGIGDPVFEKLDAALAKAVFSIGAVKGVDLHGNRAAIAQYGLLFLKDGRGRFDRGAQHNIGAVADAA